MNAGAPASRRPTAVSSTIGLNTLPGWRCACDARLNWLRCVVAPADQREDLARLRIERDHRRLERRVLAAQLRVVLLEPRELLGHRVVGGALQLGVSVE